MICPIYIKNAKNGEVDINFGTTKPKKKREKVQNQNRNEKKKK